MPELAAAIAMASLGAMLFFSAAIAPTVFQVLPEDHAGKFLRAMFPQYFLINGIAALAAGLLALHHPISLVLVASGAVMLAIRWFAIPVINEARDQMLAGVAGARTKFENWHRATVALNVVEMLCLGVAAYVLVAR